MEVDLNENSAGMEMQVRDDDSNKLSVKERRELARQRKKEDADRRRRERDEEKRLVSCCS